MSYENSNCSCGGKKLTNTMLCPTCEASFSTHPDRFAMWDRKLPFAARRQAAIRVLAMSRKRAAQGSSLPLSFS